MQVVTAKTMTGGVTRTKVPRSWTLPPALMVWVTASCAALAAPSLTISNIGPNLSGNLEWRVEVSPDAALFTNTELGLGGSVSAELAFEVVGSDLLGATVNNVDWTDVSGENPFTNSVTAGTNVNLVDDTLYTSLLSNFLVAGTAVEVMVIETSGTGCTTLAWGGHTLLDETPDEYESSLLAQAGQNYTGYQGSLTEPDYDGDFDSDCDVDGADLMEWQQNFGSPYTALDLIDWETNFGNKAPVQAISTPVPEPSTWLLLVFFQAAAFHRAERVSSSDW